MAESEIARLRARIKAESEAGQLALTGLAAGTAQHQFITTKMENLAGVVQGLIEEFGAEGAKDLIAQAMEEAVHGDNLPSNHT